MLNNKITVFTATYNRAYILENVFISLQKQKYNNFDWLIIDDGSTDNTKELVDQMINQDHSFEITYLKKNNGGKHTAINMAIEIAKGDYLFIVDSDDYISGDALIKVDFWINSINNKIDSFCAVSGLRCYPNGQVIGDNWAYKNNYIDINPFYRQKYHLSGDKAEIFRLDILKKYYPIPVFEGENCTEEGVLWNRLANAGYKIRYFNEPIYICEYLEDGLTTNRYRNWLNNFNGYTIWMKELVHSNAPLLQRFKNLCMFILLADIKAMNINSISQSIEINIIYIIIARAIILIYHKGIAKKKYQIQ